MPLVFLLFLQSRRITDYDEKKKSRNGEHGYGLRILRDTAEKYGGRLVTDDKGDTFTVVMTMRAAADSPKN